MAAERETNDRLIAHHMADRVGATFEGRIGGVTRAGLFVKLDETGADGFIPARTIGDDYFQYHEDRHAMIGRSTGETYRLGDTVTVKLVEAIPVAGALRFELVSAGRAGKRVAPALDPLPPGCPAGRPIAAKAARMTDDDRPDLDTTPATSGSQSGAASVVPARPAARAGCFAGC